MNRSLAVAVLLFATTLCISASAQSVEDQIKKMETERAAAIVKGDIDALTKVTADDYTLITAAGQVSDKAEMISNFKSGKSKITVDEISDMKVRVYGDAAVVTGKVNVKGMLGGKDVTGTQLFTRVYVKKDGHWTSVALQQTRAATP